MERQKQLRRVYYRAMHFAGSLDGNIRDAIIRMRMQNYNVRKKMDFSDEEIDHAIFAGNQELGQLLQQGRFKELDSIYMKAHV